MPEPAGNKQALELVQQLDGAVNRIIRAREMREVAEIELRSAQIAYDNIRDHIQSLLPDFSPEDLQVNHAPPAKPTPRAPGIHVGSTADKILAFMSSYPDMDCCVDDLRGVIGDGPPSTLTACMSKLIQRGLVSKGMTPGT